MKINKISFWFIPVLFWVCCNPDQLENSKTEICLNKINFLFHRNSAKVSPLHTLYFHNEQISLEVLNVFFLNAGVQIFKVIMGTSDIQYFI